MGYLSHPTRRRTPIAFTLIEVLIVVAIIGLAGALVVPQMLSAGTMGVQAASRIVIADILYAQNEAMARQAKRKITFDVEDNAYKLTDQNDELLTAPWKGGGDHNYKVDFENDSRFQGVNITAVNFGDDKTLSFDDLGGPDSGGTIDLRHHDQHFRITVAPFTGRVTVKRVED